jgi:hypothetical protein
VLASLIVNGVELGVGRVIYPRRARIAYGLPTVARWDARRLAARAARGTGEATREALGSLVIRTGSPGDEVGARAWWRRLSARR